MRVIAAIMKADAIAAILESLGLDTSAIGTFTRLFDLSAI
jgi:hypothetical protein